MKKIIFTGGGSGGHAITATTLIKKIKQKHPDTKISYIGSYHGIEKKLTAQLGIQYKAILTGKLRRYFSFENLVDIFKVALATIQVFLHLLVQKTPQTILFSTGGFVSVPPVIAASILRIPVYVHEQTSRVGLANKIASKFATKIFISFEDSKKFFPVQKIIFSGYPVRDECFSDKIIKDDIKGRKLTEISKPILFVTGGGNGSILINTLVEKNLTALKNQFFIIHQVGIDHLATFEKYDSENYLAIGFIYNVIDLMKSAKVIISRSGAGTVAELLALSKPSIFIPLKIAQKNEQYHNAMEAKRILGSIIIEEDELENKNILDVINQLLKTPNTLKTNNQRLSSDIIINEIYKG